MSGFVQSAAVEPDRLSFQATVTAVDGTAITLDQTYFFAESGGQPADRGTLNDIPVTDVQMDAERIRHHVEDEDAFAVGDSVQGEIDPVFRRYCKRAHTASHVIYGAARGKLTDLGYGGFEISEDKVRIDFASGESIDRQTVLEIERLANEAVWESRAVTWEEISREDALESDDIAFNTATEDIFATTDQVRIVEVDGWDRAACGGTHLRNTAEIGPIVVLDRSNPGKDLTRVEFAVGPAAINRISAIHGVAQTAANSLDTTPRELPSAISTLKEDIASKDDRIESLERELLQMMVAGFETIESDSSSWKVGVVPTLTTDDQGQILLEAVDDEPIAVIVALSGKDRTTITVASNGSIPANAIMDHVTDQFGGGGGGSEAVAQGGGIPESPENLATRIRETIIPQFS